MRVSLGLTYSRKAAKKKLAIVKNYKFKPSVVKKVNRLIFFLNRNGKKSTVSCKCKVLH